jgi:hypothetical protein
MLERFQPQALQQPTATSALLEVLLRDSVDDLTFYDTPEGLRLIADFIDPITTYSAIQLAAFWGLLNVFRWLDQKKIFTLRTVVDEQKNSLLMIAASAGQVSIIKYIFNEYADVAYALLEQRNLKSENAMEVAEDFQQYAAEEFLAKQSVMEELREANRDILDVMPDIIMDLSTFVRYGALTVKGMALMLHYYASSETPLYLATGILELINTIDLFMESKEEKCFLLLNEGCHRFACKLEKFDGKTYVIILDSAPTKRQAFIEGLPEEFNTFFVHREDKPILCMNNTNQQTDKENCSYFALKNLHKLMAMKNILALILSSHFVSQKKKDGIKIITYRLPAKFMSLAESPDALTKYIVENPEESAAICHVNKQNALLNLREYALQARDGFGVVTPQMVTDRNDNTKMAAKNNSVLYFKEKFHQHVVPTLFQSFSELERQKQLTQIVNAHNVNRLVLDDSTGKLTTNEAIYQSGNSLLSRKRSSARQQ